MSLQQAAARLAADFLRPRAQLVDSLQSDIHANFDAIAAAGLAGLTVPTELGGAAASLVEHRTVARELAAACGVTHFTLAQHWSACRLMSQGQAEPLKRRLLPELARGRQWVGIAFAHLRRPGLPILRATPTSGGYLLDGEAPWLTGWTLMDSAVFGCTLPDGRFVYVWSSFQGERGALKASEPMKLCAMSASLTVKLELKAWFVPQEHVLHFSDLPTMLKADQDNVLHATHMTLGCIRASVELLDELAARKPLPDVRQAASVLRARWETLQNSIDEAGTDFISNLARRVESIQLAVTAAHAAVTVAAGAANMLDHPAQRLFREAMFYTVQAQTREVMEGLLQALS